MKFRDSRQVFGGEFEAAQVTNTPPPHSPPLPPQEEAVQLLAQQQLEDGVQLRVQVLHGDGGPEHLL